jgi:hypothetical protein
VIKGSIVAFFVLALTVSVWAGPPNPTASDSAGNTAGGSGALSNDTTGFSNTAFGSRALLLNTTGAANTATGASALQNCTTCFKSFCSLTREV